MIEEVCCIPDLLKAAELESIRPDEMVGYLVRPGCIPAMSPRIVQCGPAGLVSGYWASAPEPRCNMVQFVVDGYAAGRRHYFSIGIESANLLDESYGPLSGL